MKDQCIVIDVSKNVNSFGYKEFILETENALYKGLKQAYGSDPIPSKGDQAMLQDFIQVRLLEITDPKSPKSITDNSDDPILKQAQKQRIEKLISDIRDLIPYIRGDERVEMLEKIIAGYCKDCGYEDPRGICQCQNHE